MLSNLRPYSAKQNLMDGANKTRHKDKMITKDKIDSCLQIIANGGSDNDRGSDAEWVSQNSLILTLLEAKVLIDRWNNYSTDIVFHTSQKHFVRQSLDNKLDAKTGELGKIDSIWGMVIHFSDDCPVNKGIMIDMSSGADTKNARNIVVFSICKPS